MEFISPAILLDAGSIGGLTVEQVVNESLMERCPDKWKVSMVVPFLKIIRPRKAELYRPVNMLPTLDKPLANSGEKSSDWPISRKTICCLGHIILAVFLDLKRDFETIDRRRLISKLKTYGFQSRVFG